MATYTSVAAKHATLSGSTGDIVELTGTWQRVQVVNRDDSEFLWVKVSNAELTEAVSASADDTLTVPPYGVLSVDLTGVGSAWVSVAGNSNPYSVQGLDR